MTGIHSSIRMRRRYCNSALILSQTLIYFIFLGTGKGIATEQQPHEPNGKEGPEVRFGLEFTG